MVSIGTETNEGAPNRTSFSSLPTGVYSVPQAGAADIVMMDAASLETLIRSRGVSCVEVMNAYLDHIENLNPKVNAIVALQDRPGLLAQARQRDAQLARGESMGPLHGFPQAVKDMQPVKGIRSTSGSPILRDFVPSADSMGGATAQRRGDHYRQNQYSRVRSRIAHLQSGLWVDTQRL